MPAVIVDDQEDNQIGESTIPRDTTLDDPTPPAPAPAPPPPAPDKFSGKTPEQLVAMYTELERVSGRQGQELGELRSTHDKFIMTSLEAAQRQPAPSKTETPDDDVTEYFVNPKAAIDKAVANHPLVKELKEKQGFSQQERAQAAFNAKHPDHEAIMAEPEFDAWVKASPSRLRRMAQADAYNFEAADDLFGTYKEIKAAKTPKGDPPPPPRDNAAADAARAAALLAGKVPSGNAAPNGTEGQGKRYRRSDLMRLRNENPEKYQEMGDEILLAYKEKRVY